MTRVSWSTAPFDAQYTVWSRNALTDAWLEMLTMAPPLPCFIMRRATI
jgi:hypothetical protein